MASKKQPSRAANKRVSDKIIEMAADEGLLPHEILLKVARGESLTIKKLRIVKYKGGDKRGEEKSRSWVTEEYYPTFSERIDCAKSAAPYFAPKLVSQTVTPDKKTSEVLTEIMKQVGEKLPG